jgi:hypothetical protein
MNVVRPTIAAITSVAVIINTALGQTCCCAAPTMPEPACCQNASRDATRHGCCAKQTRSCGACSASQRAACANANPASVATRKGPLAGRGCEERPSDLSFELRATPVKTGVISLCSKHDLGLSGPALLAMYCMWLN